MKGGARRKLGATLVEANKKCSLNKWKGSGKTVSECAALTLATPICNGGNGHFFINQSGNCFCCKNEAFITPLTVYDLYTAAAVCSISPMPSAVDIDLTADLT